MVQYDDDEMGALDCEEIEGHISIQDSEVLKLAEAYENEKTEGLKLGREIGKVVSSCHLVRILVHIILEFLF